MSSFISINEDDVVSFNRESIYVRIIVSLILGFIFIFSVINSVVYDKLRSRRGTGVSGISATGMMIVNIILSILSGAVFFWSVYRLFTDRQQRRQHLAGLKRAFQTANQDLNANSVTFGKTRQPKFQSASGGDTVQQQRPALQGYGQRNVPGATGGNPDFALASPYFKFNKDR